MRVQVFRWMFSASPETSTRRVKEHVSLNAWIMTKRQKLLPKFLHHKKGRSFQICVRKNDCTWNFGQTWTRSFEDADFQSTVSPSATAVSISTYNVVIDMPYYYYYLCWRRQLVDQFYACFHVQTRNTYRGTWYLPHSHVYNERTVPIIMAGCMAHEREGYISTSGLKYDLAVVFLDPDFL